MQEHHLWVERYRPSSFDTYVFHDEAHKRAYESYVAKCNIPNLLFTGSAGTGKTTAAQILIRAMGIDSSDVLIINASDENNVDTIRDKVKMFVSTFGSGDFKIVLLEEADYITHQGQGVLRRMMEEYSEAARFILTGNLEHRIADPIKSRCQHFKFRAPDVDDICVYLLGILKAERVKFTAELLDKFIAAGYPDIRKIVNLLQQNTHEGVLHSPLDERSADTDYRFRLIELLDSGSWPEARKLVCSVSTDDYDDVYRFLYMNIHKCKPIAKAGKVDDAIVTIAEYLYRDSAVADREINLAALMISLGMLV